MSTLRVFVLAVVVATMAFYVFVVFAVMIPNDIEIFPSIAIVFVGGYILAELALAFDRLDTMGKNIASLLEEQKKTNSVLTRAADRQRSRLNRE